MCEIRPRSRPVPVPNEEAARERNEEADAGRAHDPGGLRVAPERPRADGAAGSAGRPGQAGSR